MIIAAVTTVIIGSYQLVHSDTLMVMYVLYCIVLEFNTLFCAYTSIYDAGGEEQMCVFINQDTIPYHFSTESSDSLTCLDKRNTGLMSQPKVMCSKH